MFKLGKGILVMFSVAMLWAPGALAATPEEIYNDLADNGQLNATYTQAELQAFLQSASVQGYGNPTVAVVPPVVVTTPTTVVTPPATVVVPPAGAVVPVEVSTPQSGVAGTSKTIAQPKPKARPAAKPATGVAGIATPAQTPLARTASAETLPFTGAELALFVIFGTALLLGGFLLRASARQR